MGAGHDHTHINTSKERPLVWALALTTSFLLVEVAGGLITGSLALLSDAAHMLTDVTALAIALVAIKIGKRPADTARTFGYYRFEILAAAFNTTLLFVVAIYILFEAYQRLGHPAVVYPMGMLAIASIGLVVNLVSMKLLMAGKETSLNIKSAYLEVWSDALGSIGVIIGAVIIRFTGWTWVDSIIAVLIGLWVLPRTWILLKESINLLLEGVPKGIDIEQLKGAILQVEGVLNLHELHIWGITSDRISLTAHVVIGKTYPYEQVLPVLHQVLLCQFGIAHTTFQPERDKCLDEDMHCYFSNKGHSPHHTGPKQV